VADADLQRLARACRFEFYRGSGPGGQHRNKVETGVRVIHIPSGLIARASERRSREQNRTRALQRLEARLAALARVRPPRVATRKPRTVREEELSLKKRAAKKKQARKPPAPEA
jgi:protein subunit release factor B